MGMAVTSFLGVCDCALADTERTRSNPQDAVSVVTVQCAGGHDYLLSNPVSFQILSFCVNGCVSWTAGTELDKQCLPTTVPPVSE